MDKLLFDAKCKRCGSINEINYVERFEAGRYHLMSNDPDELDIINNFIRNFDKYEANCPKCNMYTIHESVTTIKKQ